MRGRHRPNWPLRLCVGGVLFFALFHAVAGPVIEYLQTPVGNTPTDHALRLAILTENFNQHVLESIVGIWILFLGASIGSFLNVVVYRLPLGRSLVAKGSYCPHCRVPIRSSDNIPVLGWLKLRGRCRACRLPISSRYPIVEATVGIFYFVLLVIELASGGANLPGVDSSDVSGVAGVILGSRWDLCGLYLFHVALFSILVPAVLIRWDGHQLPRKLVAFGLVFPAFVVSAFPVLIDWFNRTRHEVPLSQRSLYPWRAFADWETAASQGEIVQSITTFAVGAAIGSLVGLILGLLETSMGWRIQRAGSERQSAVIGFMLCGAFLGWQSVFAAMVWWVGILAIAAFLSVPSERVRDVSLLGWISIAIFVHLVTWRITSDLSWMPSESISLKWLVITSTLTLTGATVVTRIRSRIINQPQES